MEAHILKIKDENGNWIDIPAIKGSQGEAGQDGADGQDGFSPSATVTQSGDVTTITITDKDGTTEESIDLSDKQNVTDNTLQTTSKTIVGAINEINAKPSMPELDEVTITTNSDDELQTVAVIDNNGNALKTWTGTKAQYDAITTKDSNTLYNITDDSDITLTLLETIYPVGSIYITTNNTCPLSALFGTWQLVGADRVLQGAGSRGSAGTTLNESLPNITGSVNATCSGANGNLPSVNGAITVSGTGIMLNAGTASAYVNNATVSFNAYNSSSTYQDNAPVQPDAYLVNIFRRVA